MYEGTICIVGLHVLITLIPQLSQHFHHMFVDAQVSWSVLLGLGGRSIL